jgi:hypothetical protein
MKLNLLSRLRRLRRPAPIKVGPGTRIWDIHGEKIAVGAEQDVITNPVTDQIKGIYDRKQRRLVRRWPNQ